MVLDLEDVANLPVTLTDVKEARAAVAKTIVTSMLSLPPEIAVQMPNVHRCLGMLERFMESYQERPLSMSTSGEIILKK